MKFHFTEKAVATVAVVLGAITAASTAHARNDMNIAVELPALSIRVKQASAFSQPSHVVQGVPGQLGQFNYRRDGRWHKHDDNGYSRHDRHGVANNHSIGRPSNQWNWPRLYGPYGDLDRDGIRNRHDRDRDGDGIPNRHDQRPDHPRGR